MDKPKVGLGTEKSEVEHEELDEPKTGLKQPKNDVQQKDETRKPGKLRDNPEMQKYMSNLDKTTEKQTQKQATKLNVS